MDLPRTVIRKMRKRARLSRLELILRQNLDEGLIDVDQAFVQAHRISKIRKYYKQHGQLEEVAV